MGDVTIKVDADTGKAFTKLLKVVEAQEKIGDSADKAGKTSKKANDGILAGLKSQAVSGTLEENPRVRPTARGTSA